MSQNAELILLCPETSPELPARVSQHLAGAGLVVAAGEQWALGVDQRPRPRPLSTQSHAP